MTSPRSQLLELVEQGHVPAEKIGAALRAAKVVPVGNAWRVFLDRLLLWLGGLALAFAVMFFIAYNWDAIGHFAKFGMVELILVLSMVAYCKLGAHSAAGKVTLLFTTICLGVLLALYGQTYQTGADPWQLFFTWALLMLPWAFIGQFAALWMVWILLINISLILYHQTFWGNFWFMLGYETGVLWLLFLANALFLAAWEFLTATRRWCPERWAVHLLAVGSGVPLTWLVLHAIFDDDGFKWLPALAWAAWLAVMYSVYRNIKPDLFILAGCCLSAIAVSVSFAGKHILPSNSAVGFLLLASLVIALGAGATFWLKCVHQELQP